MAYNIIINSMCRLSDIVPNVFFGVKTQNLIPNNYIATLMKTYKRYIYIYHFVLNNRTRTLHFMYGQRSYTINVNVRHYYGFCLFHIPVIFYCSSNYNIILQRLINRVVVRFLLSFRSSYYNIRLCVIPRLIRKQDTNKL